eukprot:351780-Chlamydomonas_euryale.AAC.5
MGLCLSSCCLLKGWWDCVEWSAGHAPSDGIGLLQLSAQFSHSPWQDGFGMRWLRTAHSGMPFVTAPSPLFDPLLLAAISKGIYPSWVRFVSLDSDSDSLRLPSSLTQAQSKLLYIHP